QLVEVAADAAIDHMIFAAQHQTAEDARIDREADITRADLLLDAGLLLIAQRHGADDFDVSGQRTSIRRNFGEEIADERLLTLLVQCRTDQPLRHGNGNRDDLTAQIGKLTVALFFTTRTRFSTDRLGFSARIGFHLTTDFFSAGARVFDDLRRFGARIRLD